MAGRTLSRVLTGRVMHRRKHPVENRFVYPVFALLLNLDELDSLNNWLFGVNRFRPLSFNFADHGDGGDPRQWARAQLQAAGITDCKGAIWVQTFPRVFGLVFNPVSFWYCQRADGSVGAILAEVNNTFGGRHVYLLRPDAEGHFQQVSADKRLYVSPFYPLSGSYKFYFNTDLDSPRVRIDYYDEGRLQLNTAIWGNTRLMTRHSLMSALLRQPLLTLGVLFRIHWQAVRLWVKGVPISTNPSSSVEEISR